ncbi:YdeI/OmpD-associated family protein [Nonomuraea sp. NPDC050680]|uniref:YdeI/OmpD-associated family protein n=1 Tax=Nonomuraea sp. NPDC050680 TaxID=3154630 RepID=UPI0033D49618
MKFRAYVEPAEPMRGLEVPEEVVEALGGGRRPRVSITINGHSWKSRVAIMRGRHLLGLSNANRRAAGVVTGDEVEVEVEFDAEPPVVVEPVDFVRALDADPIARAAYDRLAYSHKREHVLAIESAKKPETRVRRIEKALAMLRDREPTKVPAARAKTWTTTPTRPLSPSSSQDR